VLDWSPIRSRKENCVTSRKILRRTTGAAVALILGLTAAFAPASPAAADPKPTPPGPDFGLSSDSNGDDAEAVDALTCTGYATPPSTSGGWLLWEGHIVCNQVVNFKFWINIYKIVGTGENEHSVWVANTNAKYKTGTWIDIYDDEFCQGTTSTRYYSQHYGEINGVHMSPYPANSPTTTLACYLPAL
jgi:hypothetical protein